MYVEDPNEQKAFLHSEEEEKPEVTGDPTETAEDHDLNPDARATGTADGLLEEVDDKEASNSNGPGDDDDDDLDDDPDSDDDLDDDIIDNDLNTDDKDMGIDEEDDEETYLK